MELDNLANINWKYIIAGLEYYSSAGFKYIEVPWIIPEDIIRITFKDHSRFKTEAGWLVGSGEQSFLYLSFNDKLPPGKYMTITPCFRDDPIDTLHQKQFLKLELYITDLVTEENLLKTINLCQEFFEENLFEDLSDNISPLITEVTTIKEKFPDGSYDITCQGTELGSYGIREYSNYKWIYATGVAEPRMSQVQKAIFPNYNSNYYYEKI